MILVVEDDADLRETILEVLEGAGFEVVLAGNGREALEALQTRREPALILLDLCMPVMDGVEFRHRQLENPSLASVPVVLLSARALKKPSREQTLLQLVTRYCGEN